MTGKLIFTGPRGKLLALLVLVFYFALPTVGAGKSRTFDASKPTRMKFMRGAISGQVRGQLTKNKSRDAFFIINAKAGDHMIVNIISLTPGLATSGDVTSPSGVQDGQHGGIIFSGDLTETGDYVIRVARNLMGTQRPDGSFVLEVVLTPSYLKK